MDAERVKLLIRHCPVVDMRSARTESFVNLHANPSIGWLAAKRCASAKKRFPILMVGREAYVFQAYILHVNRSRYDAPIVEAAHHLSTTEDAPLLKALLMAGVGQEPESHLRAVAERTRHRVEVVSAFETLFFNVLDRSEDGCYLANLAYPAGRIPTFDKDYMDKTPLSNLLLRVAYDSRDLDLVHHLAGLDGEKFVEALKARTDAEHELRGEIFGNAQILGSCGMVNSKSIGLDRAATLLSKKGKSKLAYSPAETPLEFDLGRELREWARLAALNQQERSDLVGDNPDSRVFESKTETHFEKEAIHYFPSPRNAVWKNKDFDQPVVVVGIMKSPGFSDHYLTSQNTGLPAAEVTLESQCSEKQCR